MAQSLLWLLAFFWHVTRPLLAILIDPDLPLNGFCGPKVRQRQPEIHDLVEEAAPLRVVQPLKEERSDDSSTLNV